MITASAAYLHQLWKYNRDAYQARVDDACKLVFAIADSAAEYWASSRAVRRRTIGPTSGEQRTEKQPDLDLMEIKIAGHLKQVEFLRLTLQPRFSRTDRDILIERTGAFIDAITGGEFGSKIRAADPVRAQEIYRTAADLVAQLRAGAERGNKLWMIAHRWWEHARPYRRPTTRLTVIEEMIWASTFWLLFFIGLCFVSAEFLLAIGFI